LTAVEPAANPRQEIVNHEEIDEPGGIVVRDELRPLRDRPEEET
jgi:hypothetical protein